ncbi:hypothetical protein M1293_02335 [Candidatus Parvarchaeota archaeon]|nr:hypothetical protein [Candidatus Parvarchaeota archaeon]
MGTATRVLGWVGGIMVFFGLSAFVFMYALNSSGALSPGFLHTAISSIINYSSNSSNVLTTSSISASNESAIISQALSKISSNPNCNVLCLLSVNSQSSSISPFLTQSAVQTYQWLSLLVAIIGAVLIFLGYKFTRGFQALGRNLLTVAILSFVDTYVPLVFILPLLFKINISNISIRIPPNLFTPFVSVILMLDILFGVTGVILLVVGAIASKAEEKRYIKQVVPPK